ncbi:hypothetical protein VaNZ11_009850 [Volvox africanus]|uniref:AB hydrolase-1 domain-containing protein n=1 Tax=Volvox africanus TaxID=51714 RepID=A0ABQ5S887_9CHLO|nr:hypothetical protein VaNZ11_009850 [Volvox africanus]
MPINQNIAAPVFWEVFAILRIATLALLEAFLGILSWPFVRRKEEVALSYISTEANQRLIDGCPAIKAFSCSPWAVGPHAQTFFSVIKLGASPIPRKELVTMPDGVQIALLWFEPKLVAEDAPLVVSLHGIGGDENSVRPIVLAEECMKRGWRSVLYVRRGHGDSSLLPVAPPPSTGVASPKESCGKAMGPAVTAAGGGHTGATGAACAAAASAPLPSSPLPPAVSTISSDAAATVAALDLSPPTSPPTAVTTVTIIATDGGEVTQTSEASHPETPTGCLSSLQPACIHAAAAPVAKPDLEALRRTRKAFPQHADTEDFHVVLQHIRAARPRALMMAVGFSMGSNVLVKFLGEHPPASSRHTANTSPEGPLNGERDPRGDTERLEEDPKNLLAAAVSVSNGYDLIEGTRHLVSSRPMADRIITAALHKLLRRRLPEVHAICAAHGLLVDFNEVLACNTIRDFERALMLPISGHDDLDEYYRHNNCREALMNVRTPLLCLSARDDPIIDPSLLQYAEDAAASNPHVLLAVTGRGGHLGWLQGWTGKSWMMDVIVQFVESVVQLHAAGGDSDSAKVAVSIEKLRATEALVVSKGNQKTFVEAEEALAHAADAYV